MQRLSLIRALLLLLLVSSVFLAASAIDGPDNSKKAKGLLIRDHGQSAYRVAPGAGVPGPKRRRRKNPRHHSPAAKASFFPARDPGVLASGYDDALREALRANDVPGLQNLLSKGHQGYLDDLLVTDFDESDRGSLDEKEGSGDDEDEDDGDHDGADDEKDSDGDDADASDNDGKKDVDGTDGGEDEEGEGRKKKKKRGPKLPDIPGLEGLPFSLDDISALLGNSIARSGGKAGDGTCCKCPEPNPDARWPDVRGSAILNDQFNQAEYKWGKEGEEDPSNPSGRKQQKKPGCCPCKTDDDSASASGSDKKSTAAGNPLDPAMLDKVKSAVDKASGMVGNLTSKASGLLSTVGNATAGAKSQAAGLVGQANAAVAMQSANATLAKATSAVNGQVNSAQQAVTGAVAGAKSTVQGALDQAQQALAGAQQTVGGIANLTAGALAQANSIAGSVAGSVGAAAEQAPPLAGAAALLPPAASEDGSLLPVAAVPGVNPDGSIPPMVASSGDVQGAASAASVGSPLSKTLAIPVTPSALIAAAVVHKASPWTEILSLVKAQNELHRILVYGDAIDSGHLARMRAIEDSNGDVAEEGTATQNGTNRFFDKKDAEDQSSALEAEKNRYEAETKEYHRSLSNALASARAKEILATKAVDFYSYALKQARAKGTAIPLILGPNHVIGSQDEHWFHSELKQSHVIQDPHADLRFKAAEAADGQPKDKAEKTKFVAPLLIRGPNAPGIDGSDYLTIKGKAPRGNAATKDLQGSAGLTCAEIKKLVGAPPDASDDDVCGKQLISGDSSILEGATTLADSALPSEIVTAFRLLSRGTAARQCVSLGAVRCTATLQEALATGDDATASAITELLRHAEESSEALARLRHLRDQARIARERFVQGVEQGRPAKVLKALEDGVRQADAALASEAEWHSVIRSSLGLPLEPIQALSDPSSRALDSPRRWPSPLYHSGAGTSGAKEPIRKIAQLRIGIPSMDKAFEEDPQLALKHFTRRVLQLYSDSSSDTRSAIGKACAMPGYSGKSTPADPLAFEDALKEQLAHLNRELADPSSAAPPTDRRPDSDHEYLAPLSVQCLCASVGPVRCVEGLFRSYLYAHTDVVEALAMVRAGNITGPARTFCDVLGEERCLKAVLPERAKGAGKLQPAPDSVHLLWNVLHGSPVDSAQAIAVESSLAFDPASESGDAQDATGKGKTKKRDMHQALAVLSDAVRNLKRSHGLPLQNGKNGTDPSLKAFEKTVLSTPELEAAALRMVIDGASNVTVGQLMRDMGIVVFPRAISQIKGGVAGEHAGDGATEATTASATSRYPGFYSDAVTFDSGSLYSYLRVATSVLKKVPEIVPPEEEEVPEVPSPAFAPDDGSVVKITPDGSIVARRPGICAPMPELVTEQECVGGVGACTLLRPGFPAMDYLSLYKTPPSSSTGGADIGNVTTGILPAITSANTGSAAAAAPPEQVEMPRGPGTPGLTIDEAMMSQGGANGLGGRMKGSGSGQVGNTGPGSAAASPETNPFGGLKGLMSRAITLAEATGLIDKKTGLPLPLLPWKEQIAELLHPTGKLAFLNPLAAGGQLPGIPMPNFKLPDLDGLKPNKPGSGGDPNAPPAPGPEEGNDGSDKPAGGDGSDSNGGNSNLKSGPAANSDLSDKRKGDGSTPGDRLIITNRTECLKTVDPYTKQKGRWTSDNVWVPFAFPQAMVAAVRTGEASVVDKLLRTKRANINALLAPDLAIPRPIRPSATPSRSPSAVPLPSPAAAAAVDGAVQPAVLLELVEIAEREHREASSGSLRGRREKRRQAQGMLALEASSSLSSSLSSSSSSRASVKATEQLLLELAATLERIYGKGEPGDEGQDPSDAPPPSPSPSATPSHTPRPTPPMDPRTTLLDADFTITGQHIFDSIHPSCLIGGLPSINNRYAPPGTSANGGGNSSGANEFVPQKLKIVPSTDGIPIPYLVPDHPAGLGSGDDESSALHCSALWFRPLDLAMTMASGHIASLGTTCMSANACKEPALPPAQQGYHAAVAALPPLLDMVEALIHKGARSAYPLPTIALKWFPILSAHKQYEDLTLGNLGHGKHGMLDTSVAHLPWWKCATRKEDALGCDGITDIAMDLGDLWEFMGPLGRLSNARAKIKRKNTDDELEDDGGGGCNAVTGEGCQCSAPEPASSAMECDPDTGRKRRKRIIKTTTKKTTEETERHVENKAKAQQGSSANPKRCTVNPFEDILGFIFCIILLILEMIMKALFSFLEVDSSHWLQAPPPRLMLPMPSSALTLAHKESPAARRALVAASDTSEMFAFFPDEVLARLRPASSPYSALHEASWDDAAKEAAGEEEEEGADEASSLLLSSIPIIIRPQAFASQEAMWEEVQKVETGKGGEGSVLLETSSSSSISATGKDPDDGEEKSGGPGLQNSLPPGMDAAKDAIALAKLIKFAADVAAAAGGVAPVNFPAPPLQPMQVPLDSVMGAMNKVQKGIDAIKDTMLHPLGFGKTIADANEEMPDVEGNEGGGPCTCFCDRHDKSGFLPLPPIAGHAMVLLDGGTTPAIIGGYCIDDTDVKLASGMGGEVSTGRPTTTGSVDTDSASDIDAATGADQGVSSGDLVYSSRVYYLRVGKGADYNFAMAAETRINAARGDKVASDSGVSVQAHTHVAGSLKGHLDHLIPLHSDRRSVGPLGSGGLTYQSTAGSESDRGGMQEEAEMEKKKAAIAAKLEKDKEASENLAMQGLGKVINAAAEASSSSSFLEVGEGDEPASGAGAAMRTRITPTPRPSRKPNAPVADGDEEAPSSSKIGLKEIIKMMFFPPKNKPPRNLNAEDGFDVIAFQTPGMGVLPDAFRNISHTGHAWFQAGQPPVGLRMQGLFGSSAAEGSFMVGHSPMHPRAGHSAVAVHRLYGDGSDRLAFLAAMQYRNSDDARSLSYRRDISLVEELEVLWPADTLKGVHPDPKILLPNPIFALSPPGAVRFALRMGRNVAIIAGMAVRSALRAVHAFFHPPNPFSFVSNVMMRMATDMALGPQPPDPIGEDPEDPGGFIGAMAGIARRTRNVLHPDPNHPLVRGIRHTSVVEMAADFVLGMLGLDLDPPDEPWGPTGYDWGFGLDYYHIRASIEWTKGTLTRIGAGIVAFARDIFVGFDRGMIPPAPDVGLLPDETTIWSRIAGDRSKGRKKHKNTKDDAPATSGGVWMPVVPAPNPGKVRSNALGAQRPQWDFPVDIESEGLKVVLLELAGESGSGKQGEGEQKNDGPASAQLPPTAGGATAGAATPGTSPDLLRTMEAEAASAMKTLQTYLPAFDGKIVAPYNEIVNMSKAFLASPEAVAAGIKADPVTGEPILPSPAPVKFAPDSRQAVATFLTRLEAIHNATSASGGSSDGSTNSSSIDAFLASMMPEVLRKQTLEAAKSDPTFVAKLEAAVRRKARKSLGMRELTADEEQAYVREYQKAEAEAKQELEEEKEEQEKRRQEQSGEADNAADDAERDSGSRAGDMRFRSINHDNDEEAEAKQGGGKSMRFARSGSGAQAGSGAGAKAKARSAATSRSEAQALADAAATERLVVEEAAEAKANWLFGLFGPDKPTDIKVAIESPLYVGYTLNSTASIFDAIVVFGGYDGARYFGDAHILYRFATKFHQPCALPGSNGFTCMFPYDSQGFNPSASSLGGVLTTPEGQASMGTADAKDSTGDWDQKAVEELNNQVKKARDLHSNRVAVAYRLVGGHTAAKNRDSFVDPERKLPKASGFFSEMVSGAMDLLGISENEDMRNGIRPERSLPFDGFVGLRGDVFLNKVQPTKLVYHMRDPLHYAWTWRWEKLTSDAYLGSSVPGAPSAPSPASPSSLRKMIGTPPSPRSDHSSSVVAGELMVLVGGKGAKPLEKSLPAEWVEARRSSVFNRPPKPEAAVVSKGGPGPSATPTPSSPPWSPPNAQHSTSRVHFYSDVHAFHIPTLTWLKVQTPKGWPARAGHSATVGGAGAGSQVFIYGGQGAPPEQGASSSGHVVLLDDVWVLDTRCITHERWMAAKVQSGVLRAKSGEYWSSATGYDEKLDRQGYQVPLPVTRFYAHCSSLLGIESNLARSASGQVPLGGLHFGFATGQAADTSKFVASFDTPLFSPGDAATATVGMIWRRLAAPGKRPSARFGHASLLLGSRLMVIGGFGMAPENNGDWRSSRKLMGLRSDTASLSIPFPLISSVRPNIVTLAGRILRSPKDSLSSSVSLARFTIKGRNFGSCGGPGGVNSINGLNTAQGRWVKVAGGKVMCAASCPAVLGDRGRCDPRRVSFESWQHNNDGAIASVSIAGYPCIDILWYSPFAFTCTVNTAEHPDLAADVSKGVVVTLMNGLSSSDVVPSPGEENVASGDLTTVAQGAYRAPPLLRQVPPEVVKVLPNALLDHPSRGPLIIIGQGFGTPAMWKVSGAHDKKGKKDKDKTGSQSAFSPEDARHVARLGGELRPDGSISFTHTRATLQTAVYSRLSGTDLANMTGPALPLAIWVGRRPCLRAVWYSDSVVTCECVQRDKRDDATITPQRARAVLKDKIRLAFVERESDLFLDSMPAMIRMMRTTELFFILTGERPPAFDPNAISSWAAKKAQEVRKDKALFEAMEKIKLQAADKTFQSQKQELQAKKQALDAAEPVPLSFLEKESSSEREKDNSTVVVDSLDEEKKLTAAFWIFHKALDKLWEARSAEAEEAEEKGFAADSEPASFLETSSSAADGTGSSWFGSTRTKDEKIRALDVLHRVGPAHAGDVDSSAMDAMLFRDKRTGFASPKTFPSELDSPVSLDDHVRLQETRANRLNFWRKDWPADDYSDIFGGPRPIRWDGSPITAMQAYLKQNNLALSVEKGSLLQRLYDFVSARNRKLYLGMRPPWVEDHVVVYSQGRRSSPYYYPILPAPPTPGTLAYTLGPVAGTTPAGKISSAIASFITGQIRGLGEEIGHHEPRIVPFAFSCPHDSVLRPFRKSVRTILDQHEEEAERTSRRRWDVDKLAVDMAGGKGFFQAEAWAAAKTVKAFNFPAPYQNRDLYKFKQAGLDGLNDTAVSAVAPADTASNPASLLEVQAAASKSTATVRHNRKAAVAGPEEDVASIAAAAQAAAGLVGDDQAASATTAATAAATTAAASAEREERKRQPIDDETTCVMRVPTIEARFDLPPSYYRVYGRVVFGEDDEEDDAENADGSGGSSTKSAVISPGCGCAGLADLATHKDVITLKQIPRKCRKEMDRYAWRLGCDSLRWSVAQSCGVKAAMSKPPAVLDLPPSAFSAPATRPSYNSQSSRHTDYDASAELAAKAGAGDILALTRQLDAAVRTSGLGGSGDAAASANYGEQAVLSALKAGGVEGLVGRGDPNLGFQAVSASLEKLLATIPGSDPAGEEQAGDDSAGDSASSSFLERRAETTDGVDERGRSKLRNNRRLLSAGLKAGTKVATSSSGKQKDLALKAASGQVLSALVESLTSAVASAREKGHGVREALSPQCQALAAIAMSPRCSVFPDSWLPETMLGHVSAADRKDDDQEDEGDKAEAKRAGALKQRFSSAQEDPGSSSPATPAGLAPEFVPTTQRTGAKLISSFPLPAEPIPIVMTAVAGDIAFWERRSSSLCHRSPPPTPRKGMTAVVLGDGVSAIFYGGQGEVTGGAYKYSDIGGQFPRRPATFNETVLLQIVGDDEADAYDGYPYACTPTESDKVEALRVLPSRRRAASAGAYPSRHSRYTDGTLHHTSSGDYGAGPTYRTLAEEFGHPLSIYNPHSEPHHYVGGAAAAETDDGGFD